MKNYFGFVNDHSGSMKLIAQAAITDYNANITAVKDAATREMLDSVVNVVGVGVGGGGYGTTRQVVVSNPHVLKPVTTWSTEGGTPLWDGVGDMIDLLQSLPDAGNPAVSFLVMVTTDGQEMHSRIYGESALARKIDQCQRDGRWTFVFRIPKGGRGYLSGLGIPYDNIQEWETTAAGMAASTAASTRAVDSYVTAKAAGTKSTGSFYTNASAVNVAALTDITSEVSLYQVPAHGGRLEIKDFILEKRKTYLKGAAFVQLVKTEPKIGPKKIVLIRERNAPNRIYAGKEAREMIGMPTDPLSNARVHPGDHGAYDIFIQSESLNRLLPDNVGVIYWEKQGVPFTQADIDKFAPKPAAAPAPVALPAVVGRTKPTPSPVPKLTPQPVMSGSAITINGRPVRFFQKREAARNHVRIAKLPKGSLGDLDAVPTHLYNTSALEGKGRWFVYI